MAELDGVQAYDGYEEVDEDTVFHGGQIGGGRSGNDNFAQVAGGRRHGGRSASSRSGRARRRSGFSFGGLGGVNLREFGQAATSILSLTLGAIIICAVLLYLTFGAGLLPEFYGSLAAAMVIVVLLFYIASRLLGND